MKILQDLIAIELKKPEEKKTSAGIYLAADKWGERQDLAYIKQLPETGAWRMKEEDLVLINPYAVIDTPDTNIKLIKPEDVLAIWE